MVLGALYQNPDKDQIYISYYKSQYHRSWYSGTQDMEVLSSGDDFDGREPCLVVQIRHWNQTA